MLGLHGQQLIWTITCGLLFLKLIFPYKLAPKNRLEPVKTPLLIATFIYEKYDKYVVFWGPFVILTIGAQVWREFIFLKKMVMIGHWLKKCRIRPLIGPLVCV